MSAKYASLLWAGIFRKPGRTILTVLQIVIAFALFGVLQGIKTGVDLAIAAARADLLDVRPQVRGGSPLPLAYLDRIKALPGVKVVSLLNGFSATYQNPTQGLYVLAIDPNDKAWLTEAPEIFKISPGGLDAFAKGRTGALISAELEKKYGWKVGDQIPLLSPTTLQTNGSDVWTFNVVGTYTVHELGGSGGYAVFVALLFSTATMVAQSIRERTVELAMLKAIGFSNRAAFSLIAAESLVVWTAAAVLGLLLATIAFRYAARLVPGISMPWGGRRNRPGDSGIHRPCTQPF